MIIYFCFETQKPTNNILNEYECFQLIHRQTVFQISQLPLFIPCIDGISKAKQSPRQQTASGETSKINLNKNAQKYCISTSFKTSKRQPAEERAATQRQIATQLPKPGFLQLHAACPVIPSSSWAAFLIITGQK